MRDNLIVFARRKGRCFPGEGNQSSPYTSGAYVDGKQEISSSGFRSSGVQEFAESVRQFGEEKPGVATESFTI